MREVTADKGGQDKVCAIYHTLPFCSSELNPLTIYQRERQRRLVRSISNPDLMAAEVADLIDADPNNGHLLGDRESTVSTSSAETPPPSNMMVTYSEDTTEAAAAAMEEFLQRPTSRSVSVPFRPLAAVLKSMRGKRRGKRANKSSVNGSTTVPESLSQGDATPPPSPKLCPPSDSTSSHSPRMNRRGNYSGVFRRAKGSQLNHQKSHDPPGEDAEVRGERSDSRSLVGHTRSGSADNLNEVVERGHSRRKKKHHVSLNVEQHLQPRLQISSPLTRDWSGSELRNEELQSLVHPPPASWSKTGYLWLRMHLENRYAWTHIVSCLLVC